MSSLNTDQDKSSMPKSRSRRDFLAWTAAITSYLATGCFRQPLQKMIPYGKMPEEIVPGKPLFYATAYPLDGYGAGILVESHMGRPTKIEGNALHPASLGATDPFAQASLLGLYDPDRSKSVWNRGKLSSWNDFTTALQLVIARLRATEGRGFRLLTPTITSPTLMAQIKRFKGMYPKAGWHCHQPISREHAQKGTRIAFGEELASQYNFSTADVIVSFADDFLFTSTAKLRYAREFSHGRLKGDGTHTMNRLYVVEAAPSLTGAAADHRLAVIPSRIPDYLRALARQLDIDVQPLVPLSADHQHWIEAVAKDLRAHKGRSLVLVGEGLPAGCHALQHRLNGALQNLHATSAFTEPVQMNGGLSLNQLVDDINHGQVENLFILGGDPAYTAPANLNFSGALQKLSFSAHLNLTQNKTASLCQWHIPETHFLESWGDIRAEDGTVTIQQPLIEPLFQGRSCYEVMATLLGDRDQSTHDIVRAYWSQRISEHEFASKWNKSLRDGVVADSALPRKKVSLRPDAQILAALKEDETAYRRADSTSKAASRIDLVFRPDATIWDGQFVQNGWLQELPKPLLEICWENVVLIHPHTARALGVENRDEVEIQSGDYKVVAPLWVHPMQAENALTLTLGYGQEEGGSLGSRLGYNAYRVRTTDGLWWSAASGIRKTGKRVDLAITQDQQTTSGYDVARDGTLETFKLKPDSFGHEPFQGRLHQPTVSIKPPEVPPQYQSKEQWGMAINLNACIGCNACVVACQAENNIPIVGKEEVRRGRIMHWLRVDRYFVGPTEKPKTLFQPVPCMHCEAAPCELVCPVAATAHSQDGLNQMVYNRCVGTRYCSNNCPYKVRRFNFLDYVDYRPIIKMQRNPDVTVRTRGVMEKCSYCVQRIQEKRIDAEIEGREIADGEVLTACQQVCPTNAIVFGNIKDPAAQVTLLKAQPHNYTILSELNTRPRTSYLAKVRNPNPALSERLL